MVDLNTNLFGQESSTISIPERTGNIKKIHIKDKLLSLGFEISDFSLGDFDYIGEFTAKKQRSPDSVLYKNVGAFFRPNYERGLLISALIKKYDIKSYLEIGYGRGYSCFCAAKTMHDLGRGTVATIDPALDKDQIENLGRVFPNEWLELISFYKDVSDNFFQTVKDRFDMIYIDGDHRYEQVKKDWENAEQRFNNLVLFDDYHLPGKNQKDIEVSSLIDSIDNDSKELIIQDRRIFLDDRGYEDHEIDYGQVLIVK